MTIQKRFLLKYGYSIEDYLAAIFAIVSFYETKQKGFNKPWVLDVENYFRETSLKGIVNEIIDSLSFTWEEGKHWATETIQDNWNFKLFQEKPLLKLTAQEVIPVSKKILHEQLFESLFHKIRNSYPREDLSFMRYFGRPFEAYVQWITEKSISKSNIGYDLIQEFEFHKNQNKSPDVMIKLGDKVLVIEVKSTRISYDGLNSEDALDKTVEKLVISPINQAIQSIKMIINGGYHELITSKNSYYFMVVSTATFPTINIYEDKIRQGLLYQTGIDIKGFYHLDIEEFEYFCEIIGRKGSRPLFRLLENKFNNYYNYPFKNFLLKSSIHPRKYTLLSEKANHLYDMVFNKLQRD